MPHPRLDELKQFTDAEDFDEELDELLKWVKETTEYQCKTYHGNFRGTGLLGLCNNIVDKGARIWGYVAYDKRGKDKLLDEFEDNLMNAIYSCLYWKMMLKREQEDKGGIITYKPPTDTIY